MAKEWIYVAQAGVPVEGCYGYGNENCRSTKGGLTTGVPLYASLEENPVVICICICYMYVYIY